MGSSIIHFSYVHVRYVLISLYMLVPKGGPPPRWNSIFRRDFFFASSAATAFFLLPSLTMISLCRAPLIFRNLDASVDFSRPSLIN
jgi:hypothetical protein